MDNNPLHREMTHGYFRRFCNPRLVTIEYRVSTDFCPPLRKPSIFLYALRGERRLASTNNIFKKEREKRYRVRARARDRHGQPVDSFCGR